MLRNLFLFFLVVPYLGVSQTNMFSDDKVEKTDQEVYAEGSDTVPRILVMVLSH